MDDGWWLRLPPIFFECWRRVDSRYGNRRGDSHFWLEFALGWKYTNFCESSIGCLPQRSHVLSCSLLCFRSSGQSRSGVRLWLFWLIALRLRLRRSRHNFFGAGRCAEVCVRAVAGCWLPWRWGRVRGRRGRSMARFADMCRRYAESMRIVVWRVRFGCM
jgi:hypothetical protein